MKIPLFGGKQGCSTDIIAYALVDKEDYGSLSNFRWNLSSQGYAFRRRRFSEGFQKRELVLLHREVMGLKKGDGRQVDHKNRNRLDCRRKNLRVLKPGQQAHNMMRRGNFTSEFRGVSLNKKTKRWGAYVYCKGKKHHAGYFADERQAANAAKNLRLKLLSHALD